MCGYNSTLQCCSGQVLVVNGGFHAGKSTFSCWSRQPLLRAPPRVQCGWVDGTRSLTGTQRLQYFMFLFLLKCKAAAGSSGLGIGILLGFQPH